MKCPKCGSEMQIDEHRRYALQMCYNCGYIEGRMADVKKKETNFAHLKNLNMNINSLKENVNVVKKILTM